MNVRIPVPRPELPPAATGSTRGGVDDEELRRIERRAERFLAEQANGADQVLAQREEHDRLALAREVDAMEARAIVARAQTLRAEANTRLAVCAAIGVVLAILLGPILVGDRPR